MSNVFDLNEFKKLSSFSRKRLNPEELKEYNEKLRLYYIKLRKHIYETTDKIPHINTRKHFNPLLRGAMKFNTRFIENQRVEVIGDLRTKTDRPIIYAANHIGKFDIEIILQTLRDHAYVFLGDPEQLYQTFDWLIMHLNGVIPLDVYDKEDSFIAKEMGIRLLNQGGNLLIFSEGIWHILPNGLILPSKYGVIEMALRTGAVIVPIGIEQVGNKFYVNYGKNFSVDEYNEIYTSQHDLKVALMNILRSKKATLCWEILEKQGVVRRSDIPDDYLDKYIAERISEWPYFSREDLENRIFKQPGIVTEAEAFELIKKLDYNNRNAFLAKTG